MSATNRGSERAKDDYYSTPAWCIDKILPFLNILPTTGQILCPAAGNGEIINRLLGFGVEKKDIVGVEIDSERAEFCRSKTGVVTVCDNFLQFIKGYQRKDIQLIIENPPFKLIDDYAKACFKHVGYDQKVCNTRIVFLANISFVFSQGRAAFWKKYPASLYMLSKRPSFFHKWVRSKTTGKLTKISNDATNYCWVVWHPKDEERAVPIWRRLD